MNDAVSLDYGLSALSAAVPFPHGSPPELLSFSQGKKREIWAPPNFQVCISLWCAGDSELCVQECWHAETIVISMLIAVPRQNKQGCCHQAMAMPPKQRPRNRCGESPAHESCSIMQGGQELNTAQAPPPPRLHRNGGLCHTLWFCCTLTLPTAVYLQLEVWDERPQRVSICTLYPYLSTHLPLQLLF